MKIFKKPEDKLTEEEYQKMRKDLKDLNFSKKDEWLMIWGAIKTLLPWVIITLLGSWSLVILFYLIAIR